jgi:hypothetical protein
LDELQFKLVGEFWFDDSEVCEPLSGFWREYASQQCLFLFLQLLFYLRASLFFSSLFSQR